MKETGIIMSGNQPKLILDGIKTQIRRVVKADCNCTDICTKPDYQGQILDWVGYKYSGREHWFCHTCGHGLKHVDEFSAHGFFCPYGQVGSGLWVGETWFAEKRYDHLKPSDIPDTSLLGFTASDVKLKYDWAGRIRSSRFMPRWASRITLEITEVRAERVQEITEEDAKAEGLTAQEPEIWWQGYREVELGELGKELMHQQTLGETAPQWMIEPHRMLDRPDLEAMFSAQNRFRPLWDSLNAKRGYGWEVNPWVWVIGFKQIST